MFTFMLCLVLAGGGIGFLAGVLMAGPTSYERGWDARDREIRKAASERVGLRVLR